MAGQVNAAPVIIKRKKNIVGGGHHGGAWKVAYADFVTAMMAFFMLMWLLNATTEKQRKGIADYFNPTIPVNRISGGGDGAFGGDSVFSEQTMSQNGTGATMMRPTESEMARGDTGSDSSAETAAAEAELAATEEAILARGGESMTMEQLLRHVVTRVTDEGLVIELFDLPDAALFAADENVPSPQMRDLLRLIVDVLAVSTNEIAINGYVHARPITLIENPVWPLSSSRALATRGLLEELGMDSARIQRVTGYADRVPVTTDPLAIRNNRIEIVLLRRDR
ncbi:MAG: chemotaxis protein MotB [Rhodobacteraceae bacterium]|jgi:chemotaxis protein MotB|nr:chemotaxis protein MotB [Paracoccaceae bacterium]